MEPVLDFRSAAAKAPVTSCLQSGCADTGWRRYTPKTVPVPVAGNILEPVHYPASETYDRSSCLDSVLWYGLYHSFMGAAISGHFDDWQTGGAGRHIC